MVDADMRVFRAVIAAVALVILAVLAVLATPAAARTVHFDGRDAQVPAGWPVYRLAERPHTCVRLDRRAVYLGRPSPRQRCPSHAVGRRRAIVFEPTAARSAGASAVQAPIPTTVAGGVTFRGLGFDACAAPSTRAMAAWRSSPYRAIGVYIGGINRACAQPNLTTTWVGEQVAAGWHLIPTYVGLQAPTSSCSDCAKLSASKAGAQGTAAAVDAVLEAQSVGMGPGSPIYFDMEAYTRTSSATSATLSFLSAWTTELHAEGYVSGVYSSSASGIADLARAIGSSYALPDHVWTANWNGAQNTADPFLPADAWANHQRIHQYRGGHNETHGLVTINIDNDYLDAATVGRRATPPLLTVRHVRPRGATVSVWIRCGRPTGESCPGHIVLRSAGAGAGSRAFQLAGGRAHTFRLALNSRGRALFGRRGFLRTRLLVAIPRARATRTVGFSRSR
jgi:glycoside hydrolase-like protein